MINSCSGYRLALFHFEYRKALDPPPSPFFHDGDTSKKMSPYHFRTAQDDTSVLLRQIRIDPFKDILCDFSLSFHFEFRAPFIHIGHIKTKGGGWGGWGDY
jgi:hypothetical protein